MIDHILFGHRRVGLFVGVFFCLFTLCPAVTGAGEVGAVRRTAHLDGVEISYQDRGERDRPVLVFIHEWAGDSTLWRFQVESLADEFRVIALDLPGHGRSGKFGRAAYTMDLAADAVRAVLEHAEAADPVLIGHGMGYAVARQFLIAHPGVARALVVADGTFHRFPDDPEHREQIVEMLRDFAATFVTPMRTEMLDLYFRNTLGPGMPQTMQDEVFDVLLRVDPHVCASVIREFVKPDQWEFRGFDIPALALYAENKFEDPDRIEHLESVFPGLIHEIWNDAGHFLMLDQPDRFNDAVRRFAAGL